MKMNDTFIIAKDGLKCISATAFLVLFFLIIDAEVLTFLSTILFLFTVWVYRNPERTIGQQQDKSIVSVCDGTVKSIETLEDEDGNTSYKVVIKNHFYDTSILRVPFNSTVKEVKTVSGARLSDKSLLAERLNEKSLSIFISGSEQVIVMHTLQIASVGIKNRLVEKQSVVQGARYGLMVKGESIMILPPESRVALKVGHNVRAGETLVGYFS